MTAHQHARFIANIKGYLLDVFAEGTYRTQGHIPTTSDYLPVWL
ncbi:terpene synthase family protein [Streptomyces spectabilis]|uniref:Uncharacterized protein n=1 Tax=Streptomyces spectabilis TaxID=68270 RepID=A0A7W8B6Q9_STRST|nr:terpene synthase family protein [Streptomyces spectabilis]MBB5109852.1 hypothetical protein [Streptomyces spectabilis]